MISYTYSSYALAGILKTDLTATTKKLEDVSRDYNNVLLERSEAIDFEAKIHAILRNKEIELVGVGMVVKVEILKSQRRSRVLHELKIALTFENSGQLEGRSAYPVIKSITAGGAAAACGEVAVGDSILTVNGKDVQGMDAQVCSHFDVSLLHATIVLSRLTRIDTSRLTYSLVGLYLVSFLLTHVAYRSISLTRMAYISTSRLSSWAPWVLRSRSSPPETPEVGHRPTAGVQGGGRPSDPAGICGE